MAFLRVLCFVLLVGLAAACPHRCPTCPPLWTYHDGYCYRYFGTAKSFAQAEQHCQEVGPGHLTSITCSEENDLIDEMWKSSRGTTEGHLWIGLTDQEKEGTFIWTDGSAVTYTNWPENQPDNSANEDCGELVRVSGNSHWNDHHCELQFAYICKMAATE